VRTKTVACLVYDLSNAALLILIIRCAGIIRGDGPGGFGEVIIKGIIANLSLLFAATGLLASVAFCRSKKSSLLLLLACILSTLALVFFSAACVQDACSDGGGYCRHGHLSWP
jgi:hypothetical protein